MSWMQKLYETYEGYEPPASGEETKPWPVAHFSKQAHIEITLDDAGKIKRLRKLGANEASTLIPVTEASLGRSGSKIAPHPLCEEVSYIASDFPGKNDKKLAAYFSGLESWCASDLSHPKAEAVLRYLKKGTLWADLLRENILPLTIEGARGKKKINDAKIFVRWRVESLGSLVAGTWEDAELIDRWIAFDRIQNPEKGLCMVLGEQARLCNNHPKFVRNAGDGAKLISANDGSGFTFRGRFTDNTGQQACGVGYEVTQKAHNALRWLIQRQGYKYGDSKNPQIVVSWAIGGARIPDPCRDTLYLLAGATAVPASAISANADAGQAFATRLNLAMKGYRAKLDPSEDIVVMGLDSATPGRMAITYYRELKGSEFLDRIERWHADHAWHQNFGKDKHFVGAPAPHDIAVAVYGRRLDDKLKKATLQRLLPCIVDGQRLPRDLLELIVRHVANRVGLPHWDWEKILGIACGLYRGVFNNEGYEMALENDRRSRDYLYGRLLALAENIENYALTKAESGRETNAARFMQRFADRPASTWRTIELALSPYKSRLNSTDQSKGFLIKRMRTVDEILCMFEPDDFLSDSRLSGEFLLGYHCQRHALYQSKDKPDATDPDQSDQQANEDTP